MSVSTQCTSSTTLELGDAERLKGAIMHFYASERNAGTDPETAFNRTREFAKDLHRRAAGEGVPILVSSEVEW